MLNLNKIALVVLTSTSSAIFAGTMGPVCNPGNVSVPCERSAWEIGGHALYLKPSYSNSLGYVGTQSSEVIPVVSYVKNAPEWHWGFEVEGAYYFNTGNDLNLNWYHLGDNTTVVDADAIFGFGQRSMDPDTATIVPNWDAVNLEFGQQIDFGPFKNLRLHGGAQYARMKTNKIHTVRDPDGVQGDINNEVLQYTGFGPRIGADMSYGFVNGFGIYTNVAAAVLGGSSKFNSTRANIFFPDAIIISASSNTVVPEIEAKLGVNYIHPLAQGLLTLDVGYMWLNYFQALPLMETTATNIASDSSFSLQGPYAGLKWVGTLA